MTDQVCGRHSFLRAARCAVGGAIIRRVEIPESSCRFIVSSALDAGAVKRHVTVMYIG